MAAPALRPYDERLERLLAGAARVFADKGYHATTMRDLARATRMSLAGMYYYVRSKEELLYLIQDRCFDDVLRGARDTMAVAGGPTARLGAFMRHHVAFFAAHMAEMKVLSHEADSLHGSWARALRTKKKAYAALLASLVGETTPRASRQERAVTAYALFGMMNWIYTWYRPDGALPPDRLAERLAALALGAVSAAPTARPPLRGAS